MASILERCEQQGLRMTEQRRVIASVLSDSDDHPDVAAVHRRAQRIDPGISVATVYRTLRLFKESGILAKHEFGDGKSRYEDAERAHHDHLIDVQSGEVIEFVSDRIEALQQTIASDYGYHIVGHRLEIYGERQAAGTAPIGTAITEIEGLEILDSRGCPTVEVTVTLHNGASGRAAVPSGASTGTHEAVERRDDEARYLGMGVSKAVNAVNHEIAPEIFGLDALDQVKVDETLCQLDGTSNKERFGANAILGISLAVAKAAAASRGMSLYQYLLPADATPMLPLPMFNFINGGMHANTGLDLQEFMILPVGANTFGTAVQCGAEILRCLELFLGSTNFSAGLGDEGGFALRIAETRTALDMLVRATEDAGYKMGKDVFLGIDAAASELYDNYEAYFFGRAGQEFEPAEMIDFYAQLCTEYPIASIEDGLHEDEWESWQQLTERLGATCQLVGDDLFVTNSERIAMGIELGAANAVLIKPNQVGTLTETQRAIRLAQDAGYACVMSHRSGETEDTTIADLAVGLQTSQIKSGALVRSERVAKYNRLLRIEHELGDRAQYAGKHALAHHRPTALH